MGILDDIITDCDLLKNAAFSNNIEIMKILIQFGLHKGLDKAISLANVHQATQKIINHQYRGKVQKKHVKLCKYLLMLQQ